MSQSRIQREDFSRNLELFRHIKNITNGSKFIESPLSSVDREQQVGHFLGPRRILSHGVNMDFG